MRLSDILKKKQSSIEEKKPSEHEEPQPVSESSLKETLQEDISQEPQLKVEPEEKSVDKIYGTAINQIKEIFKNLSQNKRNISITDISLTVKEIVRLVNNNNDELLLYCTYSTVDSYIYGHSVNVSILSSVIGKEKGFSEEELFELSLAGMFHDLGMVQVLHIAEKQGKLSEPEFEEIKKHSEYIREEFKKLSCPTELKNKLVNIIIQVHERIGGNGYPSGVKMEDINVYSRIISIADVYEAMTHPRPYRDRLLPHYVLVEFIKEGQHDLDPELIKLFINRISLFPIGSYVKLNTGDIARVIGSNPVSPIRQKVKIILTAENTVPKTDQIIDLSSDSKIFIVEPVDETKLHPSDKKLLLQLRSQRWWVKDLLHLTFIILLG